MSTEKALAVVGQQQPQWNDQRLLDTIKETVCKGATDAQFRMFIEVCKGSGLNPFLKEIWFVPSVGVMAGRDGYLRVANQHPMFDGMETRVERDEKGVPVKAVCTVWRKDRSHPMIAEAYYNEYKKQGNVWSTYPSAMIAKVAEVLALKRSFAINGCVTEEEIGTPQERGSKEAQNEYLASKGIEPVPAKEKRKRGSVGFDVLKHFGEIKKALKESTGSDVRYYEILKAWDYEHADAIKDDDTARDIYRSLASANVKAMDDKKIRVQLEHAAHTYGVEKFFPVLERHGCASFDDVLALDGEKLQALLSDVKDIGKA